MSKLNSMFKKTTYITLSNRQQSIRQDALVTEKELEQPEISGIPMSQRGCGKNVRNAVRFYMTGTWKKTFMYVRNAGIISVSQPGNVLSRLPMRAVLRKWMR